MENKINVAELLKDSPSGTELDCTMYEDVYFDYIDELCNIYCYIKNEDFRTSIMFNRHGRPNSNVKSKCVIFPKGKTTWEGFVPPSQFKDGDVVALGSNDGAQLFIFKEYIHHDYAKCYMMLDRDESIDFGIKDYHVARLATEEEKQKLFDTIKANGYRWNAETKTLEKLIEPKFKVGDWIVTPSNKVLQITSIEGTRYRFNNESRYWEIYYCDKECHLWTMQDAKDGDVLVCDNGNNKTIYLFKEQRGLSNIANAYFQILNMNNELRLMFNKAADFNLNTKPATKEQRDLLFQKMKEAGYEWDADKKELKKVEQNPTNKFDITTLKPFDKVLVRDNNEQKWTVDLFSFYDKDLVYKYVCVGHYVNQCIPYGGNEHLLGTTDDCDEYYKTWE